jgi:hypothetical protein
VTITSSSAGSNNPRDRSDAREQAVSSQRFILQSGQALGFVEHPSLVQALSTVETQAGCRLPRGRYGSGVEDADSASLQPRFKSFKLKPELTLLIERKVHQSWAWRRESN